METGVEGANAIVGPWTPGMWTLRGFAVFVTAVMILVAFSQTVGPAASTSTGAEDVFEEQSRRLTVAGGVSRSPKVALGARGSMQIAWVDGRSGSLGVYHKASRDDGFTFSGDRALSTGFLSISDLSLTTQPANRTVAVAWSGTTGPGASRVFVRASADDGATWGPAAAVGQGDSASLAAAPGQLLIGYIHRDVSGPSQVRLVTLTLVGNVVRGGRGLLAFNATASDVALVLANGVAHVAWVERISGVTVIAHVSVNPATGASSPAHVIGTFHASLSGRLSLVGRGSTLGLFWSDDAGGTFDVKSSISLDGGATWSGVSPLVAGPRNETSPAAAFGSDSIGVAWQEDAVGGSQISRRILDPTGRPVTPARRISASPTWASDAALAFGTGSRDLVVAWSDARDAPSEIYADLDVLLEKARVPTMAMFAKRLDAADYTPPGRDSKATLLDLIAQTRDRAERREEARAADFLRIRVMTRFDGSLGGDPSDDLVVNTTAQADLTRIARAILTALEGGGTRAGEPGAPGPGEGSDPSPEPIPSSGGTAGAKPVITDVTISNVMATSAVVSWTVFSPDVPIAGSFVDWGIVSTSEHRTWDNTTPYSVTIAPLQTGKTYRLAAGAKWGTGGMFSSWSNYFTVYTGVALDSIRTTNVSSTLATVEWTTNVPATTSVSYGKNESNLATTLTGSPGTFHQVSITGLGMRETYFYRVKSVATLDPSLSNVSETFSFETVMRITNLTHTESLVAGSFNITFAWDTNFLGTSQVRYGENTTLFSQTFGTSGTHHTVAISGLKSKTTYYWQVYSEATNGSGIYVAAAGFSLTPNGSARPYAPSTEPKSESVLGSAPITSWAVSIVNVTFVRDTNYITAKWNTTYRANAIVKYKTGTGTWFTNSNYGTESTLTHSVQVTGLSPWTTYTFLLNSTSSSNAADIASSGNRNATTKNIAISGTPTATPFIWDVWVNWSTTASGSGVVRYGIQSIWEYTMTATENENPSHHVHLLGLLPDTTYKYRAESAATQNKKDVVADVERTVRTLVGPNDANTSSDAAPNFASALHVEPGTWSGWLNPSTPYNDTSDYFKFQAFANQQIKAKMTPASGFDYDLYLYKPSSSLAVSSLSRTYGGVESVSWDVGSDAGWWRIEVRRFGGPTGRGDYTLTFNATGGGLEKFVVDVGYPVASPQDTNYTAQTPGISIGTNWTNPPQNSSVASTALDKYIGGTIKPDYRLVSPANGSFYLNLHRTSWERYTDYLFTLQYYSSADTNVSVWNGAGWVTLALVPGQSNWRAFSFLLEHTMFYDAEPARAGLNVKLRFEKPIQIDLIAAVPWKHTTYVGSGSDDALDQYHVPGVRLLDGWVSAGQGYKNATASGGVVVVTVPDATAGYLLRMRFDGNSSGMTIQRWSGSQWVFAASASNFTSGEALFAMDPLWYVDAFPTWPGMNVKVRFVPNPKLNEVTLFSLEPVHWTTDVGVAGDNVTTNHLPGLSVFPNSDWGGLATVDGRTVRVGQQYADLYLNLPWPTGSMIGYVTYKAGNGGTVQLDTGAQWQTVGVIVGDNAWHTAVLFAQGLKVGNPETPDSGARTFHDAFGDAFVNADLQFNVVGGVTVDAMWVDVDPDGDNLTSFGEPNSYATEDTTLYILQQGSQQVYVDKNWEVLTEGRWQFDLSLTLYGSINPLHFSGVTASVDGAEIGNVHKSKGGTETDSFAAMLCTGPRKLRIESNGDVRVDVTRIAFRKLPTDPDRSDTDGDGLRDGREACGKRTDPTQADTDADGLTDYEEVYTFIYNNATIVNANATTNVTVGAVGEYRWKVTTSGSGGSQQNPVQAVIYLDGQLKWSYKSTSTWPNTDAVFDAILPKGLHSLQVQKASRSGTVTLKLVNVTKPLGLSTNALFWDTDRDGLSDGDELLGKTGWMTSPNKTDADGDGASDGKEIRTMHSDPLLWDTDRDGFRDGVDLDPLHDLVVQLRIAQFTALDSAPCQPTPCSYYARATVAGNWTNTQAFPNNQNNIVNHLLSVNVRDDTSALIKIQVFRSDGGELDVSPIVGVKTFSDTVDLKAVDRYNQQTSGEEPTKATVWYDVRVLRVGKANTLLLAPRDWSTLSNGTIDGAPSGLHRYVGENRFVFALLNVTDGQGNVASYDLETKESDGKYTDSSPNALNGCPEGPITNATGYFGSGVSFSGSGTDLYTCTSGWAAKLNVIYQSMTVAFWIRPDRDYAASGSGWAWSVGRKDLWRVGFDSTVPGLRFAVNDPTAGWRSAAAVFPLYTGRWLHIAAVLANGQDGPFHWSNLSVYANGERIAYTPFTSWTSARTGNAFLYLGWDEASGTSAGRFKGAIDEFRLYSTVLSQSAVRGLLWFLHGANNVLIPRGVFYDSKLYGGLNGSFDQNSPFAGATAYGNSNILSSNLNSRVIQMVITKNLTLAQAWGILDLARTQNKTGNVTAFPFFATSEFYTLGLAWEVSKLVSNTSVVNGGNWTVSPPPPPPGLWQLFWNTIAGWAQAVWNAVAAVGAFFTNVGKWLAAAFMATVKGLTTGDWQDFKNQVLKPLMDALEKFIRWVIDFIQAVIDSVITPLLAPFRNLYDQWVGQVTSAFQLLVRGARGSMAPGTRGHEPGHQGRADVSPDSAADAITITLFWSPLWILIFATVVAFSFLEKLFVGMTAGTAALASFAIGALVSIVVGFLLVQVIDHTGIDTAIGSMIPDWFDGWADWSFTLSEFIFTYMVRKAVKARNIQAIKVETSLAETIVALLLLGVSTVLGAVMGGTIEGMFMIVMIDIVALWMSLEASVKVANVVIKQHYPLLLPVAVLLAIGGGVTSAIFAYDDMLRLARMVYP